MTDIAQADIFFFVTTIAVIVVTVAIAAVVYHVIKVIQEVRKIVRIVERELHNLTLKRQELEVKTLTAKKVFLALARGGLFRQRIARGADE